MKIILLLALFISCEKSEDRPENKIPGPVVIGEFRYNQTEPRVKFVAGDIYILNGDEYELSIATEEELRGSYSQILTLSGESDEYKIKSNQKLRENVEKEVNLVYSINSYSESSNHMAYANDAEIEVCDDECLVFRRSE